MGTERQKNEVSLLWPEEIRYKADLTNDASQNLDLDFIVSYVGRNKRESDAIKEILLHFPQDAKTIRYRAEIFDELMHNKKLRADLSEIILDMDDLKEYGLSPKYSTENTVIWELMNRLRELDVYIACIEKLMNCLIDNNVTSEGFLKLKSYVQQVFGESKFELLKHDIANLIDDVSKIKGLELGINLDMNLNPKEVILLDITEKSYKYKEDSSFMKSFLSAMTDGFANSVVHNSRFDIDPLMNNLTTRIEILLKDVVKNIKSTLNKYVDVNGYAVIHLIPELAFYLRFAEKTIQMMESGNSFVKAEISNRECTELKGFYNYKLALNASENDLEPIIGNNIRLCEGSKRYILTGPNRGGKTTLTQGFGLSILLAQSGLYIPAISGEIYPVDNIYTHFPVDENHTAEYGRLGDEAKRIHDIYERATDRSLILLNESFSTTSFSEGLYIALDVLKAMDYLDVNLIYNTHMHDLAKIAVEEKIAKSLVMGIERGSRTYLVTEAPPVGNSYANDIAVKYGISFEQMVCMKQGSMV